jgi:hypothetical protein
MEQVVTIPENLITIFNTLSADLALPTPWPKPADYVPPRAEEPILIWGAASSVGQCALQVLRYYGYRHLIATASPAHHEYLRKLGATELLNYRDPDIVQALLDTAAKIRGDAKPTIPLVIDCIGSQAGSVAPISQIAEKGTTVAIMLPVILKHATETEAPEYSMDVSTAAQWADGTNIRGVRTHFVYQVCRALAGPAETIMLTPTTERVLQGEAGDRDHANTVSRGRGSTSALSAHRRRYVGGKSHERTE